MVEHANRVAHVDAPVEIDLAADKCGLRHGMRAPFRRAKVTLRDGQPESGSQSSSERRSPSRGEHLDEETLLDAGLEVEHATAPKQSAAVDASVSLEARKDLFVVEQNLRANVTSRSTPAGTASYESSSPTAIAFPSSVHVTNPFSKSPPAEMFSTAQSFGNFSRTMTRTGASHSSRASRTDVTVRVTAIG